MFTNDQIINKVPNIHEVLESYLQEHYPTNEHRAVRKWVSETKDFFKTEVEAFDEFMPGVSFTEDMVNLSHLKIAFRIDLEKFYEYAMSYYTGWCKAFNDLTGIMISPSGCEDPDSEYFEGIMVSILVD